MNEIQNKIDTIKKRYQSMGYSLARLKALTESLKRIVIFIFHSLVSDIELRFPDSDRIFVDGKPRKGKQKIGLLKTVENTTRFNI